MNSTTKLKITISHPPRYHHHHDHHHHPAIHPWVLKWVFGGRMPSTPTNLDWNLETSSATALNYRFRASTGQPSVNIPPSTMNQWSYTISSCMPALLAFMSLLITPRSTFSLEHLCPPLWSHSSLMVHFFTQSSLLHSTISTCQNHLKLLALLDENLNITLTLWTLKTFGPSVRDQNL